MPAAGAVAPHRHRDRRDRLGDGAVRGDSGQHLPAVAERAKALRAAQCREGWHLEDEPDLSPAAPDEMQEFWLTLRAEAQLRRDTAAAAGRTPPAMTS